MTSSESESKLFRLGYNGKVIIVTRHHLNNNMEENNIRSQFCFLARTVCLDLGHFVNGVESIGPAIEFVPTHSDVVKCLHGS
jgi:hypothetical protein